VASPTRYVIAIPLSLQLARILMPAAIAFTSVELMTHSPAQTVAVQEIDAAALG